MSQFKFYGACKARLDKKGRFSVPASFRNEISPNTFISLHSDNFLEVGEIKDMETLSASFMYYASPFIERFPKPDNEGRIVLPKNIREALLGEDRATDLIIFGRGQSFGICEATEWGRLEKSFLSKLSELLSQKPK